MLIVPRRRVANSANDPLFSSVALLLPCTGANNSTAITDFSPTTKTATAFNGARIVTGVADPWGDTTRGVLFLPTSTAVATDANVAAVSVAHSSQFNFGSADFTIEFWYYSITPADFSAIINRDGADYPWAIYHGTAVPFFAQFGQAAEWSAQQLSFGTLSAGWNHIAISRSNGVFRSFRGGTLFATDSSFLGSIADVTSPLWIGRNGPAPNIRTLSAYYSDVRITLAARYTSSFTVPSGPFSTS
jgi:hypothetical protein